MPLTSNVIIDQARALDLLDQLRVAVPEEVRQAKRINEETERIVERAQEEAERPGGPDSHPARLVHAPERDHDGEEVRHAAHVQTTR